MSKNTPLCLQRCTFGDRLFSMRKIKPGGSTAGSFLGDSAKHSVGGLSVSVDAGSLREGDLL